jgi:hypothetical protein
MHYRIEPRENHLRAVLYGRHTPEQTREFLLAVHAACRQHPQPKILIVVKQSRAHFKPEDYGLNGYAKKLLRAPCQVALVGDTQEVNAANEYIAMVARQQGLDIRAFQGERAALRWLNGVHPAGRRFRFTRIVIAGSPDEAGVYTLWNGEEVIYYGRAERIRSRLLDFYYEDKHRATHYGWEVCADPVARETELLAEHARTFGTLPRDNARAA